MYTHYQPTDVAIVGGGLAGLTAAAYLARAGKSVMLFEKAAELGGRATTQNVGGYLHNRGIHALYLGGAAEAVLKDLGIPYTGGMPSASDVSLLHDGKLHSAPLGVMSLLRTGVLSMGDKLELMRVYAGLPTLDASQFQTMSVQAWLNAHIARPAVRALFEALAPTSVYSANLDLVSADLFISKMQLSLKFPIPLYIDGGWQTLVDGLRKAAQSAGARILSRARVEEVEISAGRAVGLRLREGEAISAGAVIVATHPHDAVKLLDSAAYPALRRTVDGLIPAQVACLDVALRALPDPRHPVVFDMDAPRFLSAQSQFSQVVPSGSGGALIYAFKQLDPMVPSNPKDDERELEAFLDACQPGWRDVVVQRFFLPRIDAVGALPTAKTGGYAGRPTPDAANVQGLFLAGDWIGSGFLVDPSFASARAVAQRLISTGLATAPTRESAVAGLIH